MTQPFPTEEDFERVEKILAQQVKIGDRLAEELRTHVADALRDKLVPIEESVEAAEGVAGDARIVARQVRETANELRTAVGELQTSVNINAMDEHKNRARLADLSDSLGRVEQAAGALWGAVDDLRSAIGKQARNIQDLSKHLHATRDELLELVEGVGQRATEGDDGIVEHIRALELRGTEERREIENQVVEAVNQRIQELELAARRRHTIVLRLALAAFVLSLVSMALWFR